MSDSRLIRIDYKQGQVPRDRVFDFASRDSRDAFVKFTSWASKSGTCFTVTPVTLNTDNGRIEKSAAR